VELWKIGLKIWVPLKKIGESKITKIYAKLCRDVYIELLWCCVIISQCPYAVCGNNKNNPLEKKLLHVSNHETKLSRTLSFYIRVFAQHILQISLTLYLLIDITVQTCKVHIFNRRQNSMGTATCHQHWSSFQSPVMTSNHGNAEYIVQCSGDSMFVSVLNPVVIVQTGCPQ